MTPWPPDIAVLIPAYKSALLLHRVLPRVMEYAPADHICVVDDASDDGTAQVCGGYGITCLTHGVNSGKGAALATGFRHLTSTDARWIVTMDADGQHAPEDLPKFIAASRETPPPGICIGARAMKSAVMPPERILSNLITSRILSVLCGIRIIDSQSGYRLYSIELLKRIDIIFNRFEMESEILMKAAFLGYPVTFTGIQTLYLNGPSHISHVADTIRWIIAVLRIRMQRSRSIRGR
ncbi:MAG: glycosyltransferase family 2 protein [Chitinispirillaceae bacterium]|nr:glycosyltransferase family 2 protein [Chitinispirillaceae bacterium]